MQPNSTFVTGVMADVTPLPTKENKTGIIGDTQGGKSLFPIFTGEHVIFLFARMVLLFTVLADGPGQALSQYPQQSIGEVKGVHAHFQQAGDSLDRAVGMQSTEHQLTGGG